MPRRKTPKLVTQYLERISREALENHFKGKIHPSPSAAASAACKRGANGWWFWRYERSPGDWVRIDALRSG